MPVPLIPPGTPQHPLTEAWLAIQTCIRESASLKALGVKTYRLMDGTVGELDPPTQAQLPWLRVMLLTTPMEIGSESEWGADLKFMYELAVDGTRLADMTNLCGAFITSLSQSTIAPIVGNVQSYYRSKQIRVIEFTQAAIGPVVPPVNPASPGSPVAPPYLYARGFFRGQCYFSN